MMAQDPVPGSPSGARGKGWSGPLLTRAQTVLDLIDKTGPGVEFKAALAFGPKGGKETSSNHEAMGWGTELARAIAMQEDAAFDRAKAVVLEAYYPRELAIGERGIGLWAGEQTAPDNHSHQHLTGLCMAHIGAMLSQDTELLMLSNQLLQTTVSALSALAHPGLKFIQAPGYRCPKGPPVWWTGSAWLREMAGLPGPMPAFVDNPNNWHTGQGACVRAARWIRQNGEGARPVSFTPMGCVLKHEMNVWRWERGHIAALKRYDNSPSKEVCNWVKVIYPGPRVSSRAKSAAGRKPSNLNAEFRSWQGSAEFSLNWTGGPVPEPPAGAVLIHFPGSSAKGEKP